MSDTVPVESITESAESTTGFAGNARLLTENGWVNLGDSQSVLGRELKVWNGTEYVTGTPKLSGVTDTFVTVITTTGIMLQCPPEHPILLQDGTSVPAVDLKLDQPLHRSEVPEFPGRDDNAISHSMLLGCIYGQALSSVSTAEELPDQQGMEVTHFIVSQQVFDAKTKAKIPTPYLEELGYKREDAIKFARDHNINVDHEERALIVVPDALRRVAPGGAILNAPLGNRMRFCAGLSLITSRYNAIQAARVNVLEMANLINSTGKRFEVRAYQIDRRGRWGIKFPDAAPDDMEARAKCVPCVASLSKSTIAQTSKFFTVDGVKGGRIMLNGVLCTINVNKSKPEQKKEGEEEELDTFE